MQSHGLELRPLYVWLLTVAFTGQLSTAGDTCRYSAGKFIQCLVEHNLDADFLNPLEISKKFSDGFHSTFFQASGMSEKVTERE